MFIFDMTREALDTPHFLEYIDDWKTEFYVICKEIGSLLDYKLINYFNN